MNDIAPAVLEKIQGSPLEKEKLDEQRREQRKKEKKKQTFEVRQISFDGLMPWSDVSLVVPYTRKTIWLMEKAGSFPARRQCSSGRIAWMGPEVLEWIQSRPRVISGESCEIEDEVVKI